MTLFKNNNFKHLLFEIKGGFFRLLGVIERIIPVLLLFFVIPFYWVITHLRGVLIAI